LAREAADDRVVAAEPHAVEVEIHWQWLRGDANDHSLCSRIEVNPLAVNADRGEGSAVAIDRVPFVAVVSVGEDGDEFAT
jgi:hypothetical protein